MGCRHGLPQGTCSVCDTADCDIAADDFSSGDALTVDWEGDTGSFTKSGGEVTSTTSDKAIVHKTGHPDNVAEHIVTAEVKGSANGDRLRVICDYVDSSNYHFGQLEVNSTASTAVLKVYRREAGANLRLGSIELVTADLDTFHTLKVCITESVADTVSVTFGATVISAATVAHGGDQAGVGTGSVSGTATLDDFDFDKHYDDTNTPCTQCISEESCKVVSDDFNRGDSSDIGEMLEETSGAWEIATNKLSTSSANALAKCTVPHPDDDQEHWSISADVSGSNSGDQAILFASYEDSSNYVFAQVTFGTSATLKVFTRVGGTDTERDSETITAAAGSTVSVNLCVVNEVLVATVGAVVASATILGFEPSGDAGVGTKTVSGTVTFDNVEFEVALNESRTGCDPCLPNDITCGACSGSTKASAFYLVELVGVIDGVCELNASTEWGGSTAAQNCDEFNVTYLVGPGVAVGGQCGWDAVIEVSDLCPSNFGPDDLDARVFRLSLVTEFAQIRVFLRQQFSLGQGSPFVINWIETTGFTFDCDTWAETPVEIPFSHTDDAGLGGSSADPVCDVNVSLTKAIVTRVDVS